MKTPTGMPRIAPMRKPQAAEPASQPIRMQSTITAAVVPIRTEPAAARLSFGVGDGSIRAASIAELVTLEIGLGSGKTATLYDPAMGRLVLVHGSVTNGSMTWGAQRALGERWDLLVLDRPGFPPGPPVERVDFEADADWLMRLLQPGDHVCGHSYGGIVALL